MVTTRSLVALVLVLVAVLVGISVTSQGIFGYSTRATVLFGGDMMFDRTVRSTIEAKGGDYIFSCINEVLHNNDLVVANLEGPITSNPSKSVGTIPGGEGNYTFTFPISTASLLYRHNIRLVNIGNNHIQNFGAEGVHSTLSSLTEANVDYFGDPIQHVTLEKSVHGVRLAFINFNEFGGDAAVTIQHIEKARTQGTLPVVYAHWGEEYSQPTSRMKALAREFVDAGASLVVGSHPHIVQESDVYRDVPIYYSLGNFIFDQYWRDEVRNGLMLRVVFNSEGVEDVEEIPVELGRDRRTCPVSAIDYTQPVGSRGI